jgi:hypothetical protein
MRLTVVREVLALLLYVVGALVLGLALVPAVWFCRTVWHLAGGQPLWAQTLWTCLAAGAGYFIFGFSLMGLAALLRLVLRLDPREGTYPRLRSPGERHRAARRGRGGARAALAPSAPPYCIEGIACETVTTRIFCCTR